MISGSSHDSSTSIESSVGVDRALSSMTSVSPSCYLPVSLLCLTSRIHVGLTNLESTPFERSLEVVRLTAKDDLVDVELVPSTDDLAIRELTRFVSPSES
jgi:hypothetical protein